MPRPAAAPLVRREDYRPPAWLVPEIALDFALDPERTVVRSRLEVVRAGDHREPLRLDGEGLKLLSLAVDGRPASHKLERKGLTIRLAADRAVIETVHEIVPRGAAQIGLFELGRSLCTQCEAEGFRRIAFFPDRPDVLARFTVTLSGDKAAYPVLLANGNPDGAGEEEDRHWARWRDPVPKPCYLFALVAGDLAGTRARFATKEGREVALGVWTRAEDAGLAGPVLETLQAAMAWDEEAYGRTYDLDVFNIVALPDFAFGAMENKGLVLFDRALVLVDPESANDAERDSAATLVAHEYLHNWSGNRVTLRDWFQLGLKEGLTVFRDQEFCAAQGSAAVKRIEDVKALRAGQFVEDAGRRAHPVRPDFYASVSDLFTATVYVKGAEIVRMIRTWIGEDAFRAGADLYFERHDGQAVLCEDFLAAMGEAKGTDLSPFLLWYARSETPRISARLGYSPESRRALLRLEQEVPAGAKPLPIPIAVALFGAQSGTKLAERLVRLESAIEEIVVDDLPEHPLLSINRGFSAPVIGDWGRAAGDLALLAGCDDDPVARWEAIQGLMLHVLTEAGDPAPVVEAARAILAGGIETGLAAEMVTLPSEAAIAETMASIDPAAIHWARLRLRAEIGRTLAHLWRAALEKPAGDADSVEAKGARRLRGVALDYLVAGGGDGAATVFACYQAADTVTEREAALRALADSDAPERVEALADFHRRARGKPAALDKWFAVQALSGREDVVDLVPRLLAHPDFTLSRPSRVGALVGAFSVNQHALHHVSGRGYRLLVDASLAIDRQDPRAAARLAAPLARWRRFEPGRAARMKAELERLAAAPGVSAALRELAAAAVA